MAPPAEKTLFTFADYLAWNENEHIELIDGEAVMMAPPSTAHQLISGELFRQLANFLEGKKCRAIPAPFAVRLFEGENDTPADVQTVVEPDISVICDRNKLDHHGCKGAPDMVIEILSPTTRRHDRLVKLNLYQRAGVGEYWIVSPSEQTVEVFLLKDGWSPTGSTRKTALPRSTRWKDVSLSFARCSENNEAWSPKEKSAGSIFVWRIGSNSSTPLSAPQTRRLAAGTPRWTFRGAPASTPIRSFIPMLPVTATRY